MLLTVLAARGLSAGDFGFFAILYGAFIFVLGVGQSFSNQVLLIHVARDTTRARVLYLAASKTVMFLGCLAGAAALVGAFAFQERALSLVSFGFAIPLLMLQDTNRTAFLALGRSVEALACTGIFVSLLSGLLVLLAERLTVTMVLLIWAVAAFAATAYGRWRWASAGGESAPSMRVVRYLREFRKTSVPLATQYSLMVGSQQLTLACCTGWVGAPALGGLRGAQTLLGPVNILSLASVSSVVPRMVDVRNDRLKLQQYALATSALLGAVAVTAGVVASLLPDSIGRTLLGDTWAHAEGIIPVVALALIFQLGTTGPSCAFRALDSTATILRINVVAAPTQVLLVIVSVLFAGPKGLAIGLMITSVLMLPVWWIALRSRLRML